MGCGVSKLDEPISQADGPSATAQGARADSKPKPKRVQNGGRPSSGLKSLPSRLSVPSLDTTGRGEEEWEAFILAEDLAALGTTEPCSAAGAAASVERGVTIQFLLDFTRKYDCWHLPTWKVMSDIIRPATRATRSRYADLEHVRATGAVGRADTFASHCWGALWGVLVSALADCADRNRRVWLDAFAVRQWAGNSTDLDCSLVVRSCTSFVICCQASPTKQIQGVNCLANLSNSEMLARRIDLVPQSIRNQISFLRAWCLVEVMAAIEAEGADERFALVMKVGNLASARDGDGLFPFVGNSDMTKALQNLIDVTQAEAVDATDRSRILQMVDNIDGGVEALNDRVRSCITGARACSSFPEVQSAACGDEALDFASASQKKINDWLKAASGAGYPWLVARLLEKGGQPNAICTGNVTPLMSAVMSGETPRPRPSPLTPSHPWLPSDPAPACTVPGKLSVAEMLLAKCPEPLEAINRQRDDGTTPVNLAAGAGQAAAVKWLIERGADVNLVQTNGNAPLKRASQNGYTECCILCLQARSRTGTPHQHSTPALHAGTPRQHATPALHASIPHPSLRRPCTPLQQPR